MKKIVESKTIERWPNETPEGVPGLPHPWLAYTGLSGPEMLDESNDAVWCCLPSSSLQSNCGWRCSRFKFSGHFSPSDGGHIAIDVRTSYAKEHFPELVEAMEYMEYKTVREWLETLPDGYRERALNQADPDMLALERGRLSKYPTALAVGYLEPEWR